MSNVVENPHGNCALGGANAMFVAMKRVIPIFHSGPGCCAQTSVGESGVSGGRGPAYVNNVSIPCSNMLERDVVFGGIEKLETHVDGALEILDADALFILTGCTAGIIGDDVKSLARKYQDAGEKVYAVETAGFLGESCYGYELAIGALLQNIVDPNPLAKEPDLVNVIGIMPFHDPFWEGSFEEIVRLLEQMGLRANTFVSHEQGLAEVRKSSSAALNIIMSPWLLKGAEREYQEKYAIPSLRWPILPVGATDTSAFLRAVGVALGREKEAETVIEKEERYLYHYLETAIGAQSWRRFAIVGESANVAGLARFLANDFSFTPEVIVVTDVVFRPEDKALITRHIQDLEYARSPEVVFASDQWDIERALERFPDTTLLIGSANEREYASEHKIQFIGAMYPQTERLIYNRTYTGYRGALTFLEDLYSNL